MESMRLRIAGRGWKISCGLMAVWLIFAWSIYCAAQQKAKRIVSTTLTTDEVVAGLVEPNRIVAMSQYSPDPQISNVAETARKVNMFVERDPERIVRLGPDIVFSARYTNVDLKFLMQQAQIPYVELIRFETIADIESNIRTAGQALHEEKRAGEFIGEMRRKLDTASRMTAPARRGWRILYLAAGDWTAGTKTTVHDLIRTLNLRNAAAEAGVIGNNKISTEKVIEIDPDVILLGTGYARDSGFQEGLSRDVRFSGLKAVRSRRIVALSSRYLLTTSQFIADGALELARRINALP